MKELGEPTEALREALKGAAETWADAARDTIPVRTGRLKSTIRTSATNRGAFGLVGNSRVPYANPIHWGWFRDRKSERARKSTRGYINKNIKPNPFAAKALGYTKLEIYQNFTKIMDDELTKVIRRGISGRRS
jgi:hypothetical protein